MIKKCPSNNFHLKNECRCVDSNPFFYYNGKWHTNTLNPSENFLSVSWSGQLKFSDIIKDIIKQLIVYLLVLSLFLTGIVCVCVKVGIGLKSVKQNEQK